MAMNWISKQFNFPDDFTYLQGITIQCYKKTWFMRIKAYLHENDLFFGEEIPGKVLATFSAIEKIDNSLRLESEKPIKLKDETKFWFTFVDGKYPRQAQAFLFLCKFTPFQRWLIRWMIRPWREIRKMPSLSFRR